jgi:hypothetical protein
MTRRGALWMFAAFCVVLAATLVPRIGVSLLAALASLLVGAAASLWLGNAARAIRRQPRRVPPPP